MHFKLDIDVSASAYGQFSFHEEEKDFVCQFCGKDFTQKGSLEIHISGVHEEKKPLQCT